MLLNKKVKVFSWKETMYPILLKLLNSAIMIMGMYFVFRLFDLQLDTSRTVQVIILTIVVTIYGGISYLVGSMLLSQEEFKQFEKLLKKLLKRFKRKT